MLNSGPFPEPVNPTRHWLVLSLTVVVLARFIVHAFFIPVFEGPDEPFHLARAAAFADLLWFLAALRLYGW